MTSCLEASECKLSVSATVVGGVEPDDARLEEESVAGPEKRKLLSAERGIASGRGFSMARRASSEGQSSAIMRGGENTREGGGEKTARDEA